MKGAADAITGKRKPSSGRRWKTTAFTVEIEKSVIECTGIIDVSLIKESLSTAVEVSVTSTVEYEVKNVLKCLTAGYDYAFVVVSNHKKISALRTKLNAEIPAAHQEKIKAFSLTGLLGFLRDLNAPEKPASKKPQKSSGQRLSFQETCEFLNVGSSALFRWMRAGKVPFYRVGREYRFDRDELVLAGRQDLSGKRKAVVKLEPLKIEKTGLKGKMSRMRVTGNCLNWSKIELSLCTRRKEAK